MGLSSVGITPASQLFALIWSEFDRRFGITVLYTLHGFGIVYLVRRVQVRSNSDTNANHLPAWLSASAAFDILKSWSHPARSKTKRRSAFFSVWLLNHRPGFSELSERTPAPEVDFASPLLSLSPEDFDLHKIFWSMILTVSALITKVFTFH
jgi:hypothetical protein